MAALCDDVKRFVVQALACYDTPSQVAEAVKAGQGAPSWRLVHALTVTLGFNAGAAVQPL